MDEGNSTSSTSVLGVFLLWRLDDAVQEVRSAWGYYFAVLRNEKSEKDQDQAASTRAFRGVLVVWKDVVTLAGVCRAWKGHCAAWMTTQLPQRLERACWCHFNGWVLPVGSVEKCACVKSSGGVSSDTSSLDHAKERSRVKKFVVLTTVKAIFAGGGVLTDRLGHMMVVVMLPVCTKVETMILDHLMASGPLERWVSCPRDAFAKFIARSRFDALELVWSTVLKASDISTRASFELTAPVGSFVGSWGGKDMRHFISTAVKAGLDDKAVFLLKQVSMTNGWPSGQWVLKVLERSVDHSCWNFARQILKLECDESDLEGEEEEEKDEPSSRAARESGRLREITDEELDRGLSHGLEMHLLEDWFYGWNQDKVEEEGTEYDLAARLAVKACLVNAPLDLIRAFSNTRGPWPLDKSFHLCWKDGKDWKALWDAAVRSDRSDVAKFTLQTVTSMFNLPCSVPIFGLEQACKHGAHSIVAFLLEESPDGFSNHSNAESRDRLRCLCLVAAEKADSKVLSLLLAQAKRGQLLRNCLQRQEKNDAGGVLHALCKSKAVLSKLEETLDTLLVSISATRAEGGDEVVLDDLSWFDENQRLPIDYASEKNFRDRLSGVFPADAMWNQLEISSDLPLEYAGMISEKEGGSKARIERRTYVNEYCPVAVKVYPNAKDRMQDIKREIGVMSRVRFPFIMRILGWCYLDDKGRSTNDRSVGHSIGVVMDLCSTSLQKAIEGHGSKISTYHKAIWARQVGTALKYLHAQRPLITHGDVHLMNVLLSSNFDSNNFASLQLVNAVLCDFDFSCIAGTKTRLLGGVDKFPRFSSNNEDTLSKESMKALDWFMFGVTLFSVSVFFALQFCFVLTGRLRLMAHGIGEE
jgi:hypothetical protein